MPEEPPIEPGERVRAPISHACPSLGTAPGTVLAVTARGVIVEFDQAQPGIISAGHHGTVVAPAELDRLAGPPDG
jgi:hypothetical protein